MPAIGTPEEKTKWLLDRAYELVTEKFGAEVGLDKVHQPDVFRRYLDNGRMEFGLLLEEWRLSVGGRRRLFVVTGPTANSCRVRFRRRLQEVRP